VAKSCASTSRGHSRSPWPHESGSVVILNIVDRRRRGHRWKRVNAIVESTWHDNALPDADIADRDLTHSLDYAQCQNVALSDAVAWAQAMPDGVTLYLYDEGRGTSHADSARFDQRREEG